MRKCRGVPMNFSVNGFNGISIFSQRFRTAGMLKSTQDKLERQEKAQNQIELFENQKENLKNMKCDSIEDIARKLDYNEEDISSRKECAASYLLSQVCTVQFSIDNPNFIHKYVNEPLKLRSTSIKDKLKNRSKGKKTSSAISYISSTSNNFLSKSVSNISKILN